MNAISKIDPAAGDLAAVVDQLGALKARIADLTEQEKLLKSMLIDAGVTELDGRKYRVTVSTAERATLDMEAVRAKLSPQFIAAHTTVTPTVTVRVVARKRS